MSAIEDEYEWLQESEPRKFEQEEVKKTTRHGKIFRLDDLLADEAKEKKRKLEREAKRCKLVDSDSSEDDDSDTATKKAHIDTLLQECEKQVCVDNGTSEILKWGESIFGLQKKAPVIVLDATDSSLISKVLSAAQMVSTRLEGESFPDDGDNMLKLVSFGWNVLPWSC